MKKKTDSIKMLVDEKLVIALENLITVAEEQYNNRRVIDADDVIAAQSVGTVKEFITRAQRTYKRSTL